MTSARAELGTLEASGLVQVAALEPELEYLFRHALVQDAAYSSLLKQDRRTLHRLAATTLQSLYPERGRELAGVIGMHYERAGDAAAAAEQLVIAGEHALERFANKDAAAFFDRAEASLGPDDARVDLRLRAAIGYAKAAWTGGPDECVDRLERAAQSGEAGGDPKLLGDTYFWIAFLRRSRGETVASSDGLRGAVDRAAAIGASRGDLVAQALPKAFLAVGTIFSGDLREGTEMLEEAMEVIGSGTDPVSAAILFGMLTVGKARLGDFAGAERSAATSMALARNGDPVATLDADIVRSGVMVERGDFAAGEALATTCAARSEELGALVCAVPANMISGFAHLARDDAAGARPPLERVMELASLSNLAMFETAAEGMLGSVHARLGVLADGVTRWDAALDRARSTHDRFGEAITHWQRAIALAKATPPDHAAALADLDIAIALFEEMGARPSLARALRERARALRALGRTGEADDVDARSRTLGSELGLKDFA